MARTNAWVVLKGGERVPASPEQLNHTQECLRKIGRPFNDMRELKAFESLTDRRAREAFIEARTHVRA